MAAVSSSNSSSSSHTGIMAVIATQRVRCGSWNGPAAAMLAAIVAAPLLVCTPSSGWQKQEQEYEQLASIEYAGTAAVTSHVNMLGGTAAAAAAAISAGLLALRVAPASSPLVVHIEPVSHISSGSSGGCSNS